MSVLFRQAQHPAIAQGRITRTVRVWKRAQVRLGGLYEVWTIGDVRVTALEWAAVGDLDLEDARRSGFETLDDLRAELARMSREAVAATTRVARVDFEFVGPRQESPPAPTDSASLDDLRERLERLDARSGSGPWTLATLRAIDGAPGVVSTSLAVALGRERFALKTDIRKLKKLGLTVSLKTGYRISDLARAYLGAVSREP